MDSKTSAFGDLEELIRKTLTVRKHQKQYFKTRDYEALMNSKMSEVSLDKHIIELTKKWSLEEVYNVI